MSSVGAYQAVRRKMREIDDTYGNKLKHKIPKVVWRGALWVNPEVRGGLEGATANKMWGDTIAIDFESADSRQHLLQIEEHCKYMFVAHTEGEITSLQHDH